MPSTTRANDRTIHDIPTIGHEIASFFAAFSMMHVYFMPFSLFQNILGHQGHDQTTNYHRVTQNQSQSFRLFFLSHSLSPERTIFKHERLDVWDLCVGIPDIQRYACWIGHLAGDESVKLCFCRFRVRYIYQSVLVRMKMRSQYPMF